MSITVKRLKSYAIQFHCFTYDHDSYEERVESLTFDTLEELTRVRQEIVTSTELCENGTVIFEAPYNVYDTGGIFVKTIECFEVTLTPINHLFRKG